MGIIDRGWDDGRLDTKSGEPRIVVDVVEMADQIETSKPVMNKTGRCVCQTEV